MNLRPEPFAEVPFSALGSSGATTSKPDTDPSAGTAPSFANGAEDEFFASVP
jgi:hypothetical protein